MRRPVLLAVGLALLGVAGPAPAAEAPRSVISWLSNVLGTPEEPQAPEAQGPSRPEDGPLLPFDGGGIEVSSLDDPVRDGVGVLNAGSLGLPRDFWGATPADEVRRMIYDTAPAGVPAARDLYRDLLMAEAEPPAGAGPRDGVLLARVDALMAAGMLDQADALLTRAGVTDPELFRRAFDIGLLTGRADARCAELRDSPALSPTLPARVFCLARLGDWSAAALTLNLGREMGTIPEDEAALLARFLDPQLYEGDPPPPVQQPLTTLDYVLREAVALPRPTGALPLAFVVPDAADDAPWRGRIAARERLVREGAMEPSVLFAAYRAGEPAASGGVWERAAAAQALDFAFATTDTAALAEALPDADSLFASVGLRTALARVYARQLAAQPKERFTAALRQRIGSLLMLAGDREAAAGWLPDNNDATNRLMTAIALETDDFPPPRALTALEKEVARGLTTDQAPTADAATVARLMGEDRLGEAILRTLALLAPGPEIDPVDLSAALYLLRKAGLSEVARQVAAETLLLLPEA